MSEARKWTRDAWLHELREALSGKSELVMKEVWERCSIEQTAEADDELRRIIAAIEGLK